MTQMQQVEVTPDLARRWIEHAKVQRNLREARVKRYASDMLSGRWGEDIAPIVFDSAGNLANGQHRLSAVVQSGVAQTFWVLTGANPDAIKQMDTGAPRSAGDQLRFEGVSQYNLAGSIARNIIRYRLLPDVVWGAQSDASNAQIVDEVLSNRERYQRAVREADAARKSIGSAKVPSVYGALSLIVESDSPNAHMWDEWHRGMSTGAGLALDDARLALRAFFVRTEVRPWGKTQSNMVACLNAWNRWVMDEPTKLIKTPRREELPMKKVL